MSKIASVSKRLALLAVGIIAMVMLTAVSASPAMAGNTPCQDVLAVWLRGSGAPAMKGDAETFFKTLGVKLSGLRFEMLEGGNYDKTFTANQDIKGSGRYEAAGGPYLRGYFEWFIDPTYGTSVSTGTNELVNFLNQRVVECPREAIVLGGYSQGADVVGWALERNGGAGYVHLNSEAKRNIAFAALYGDPKNNAGPAAECAKGNRPAWVRADSSGCKYTAANDYAPGSMTPLHGLLGQREPYVRPDFGGRVGSWCAANDRLCNGSIAQIIGHGNHGSIYEDYWIAQSTSEIASRARAKHAELNPPNQPQPPPPPANPSVSGPPLFFVKTKNTDPAHGRVEVHTALPGLGYGDGSHAVTRFGTNEQNNGWFQMVGNDLWYIKTKNTGSGRVEIHSATAASGYRSGESFATRFWSGDQDNGWFQMVGLELFFIKTKNTGRGLVEVFSATRASNYQQGQANGTWTTTAMAGSRCSVRTCFS